MYFFYNGFGTVGMGVAHKNLPEVFLVHQGNDMRNPVFIQFVKNIVQ